MPLFGKKYTKSIFLLLNKSKFIILFLFKDIFKFNLCLLLSASTKKLKYTFLLFGTRQFKGSILIASRF